MEEEGEDAAGMEEEECGGRGLIVKPSQQAGRIAVSEADSPSSTLLVPGVARSAHTGRGVLH